MERHVVSSSRIRSIGWDNCIMEVEFHNGSVYQYYDVSQTEYQRFLLSPSLGSALSKLDKVHKYRRVR